MSDDLKVYTKKETQKLLGISGRTWDRLEALGETPPKTRLSPNRIGYRGCDIGVWLDARREPPFPATWSTTGSRLARPPA